MFHSNFEFVKRFQFESLKIIQFCRDYWNQFQQSIYFNERNIHSNMYSLGKLGKNEPSKSNKNQNFHRYNHHSDKNHSDDVEQIKIFAFSQTLNYDWKSSNLYLPQN